MEQEFFITGKTLGGLEDYFLKELEASDAEEIAPIERGFRFKGDEWMLYRLNYTSRLGIRFLKEVLDFEIRDKQDFFTRLYRFPWNSLITQTQTIAIEASCEENEVFENAQDLEKQTKEALDEHFGKKYGERPIINKINPDLLIKVQISGKICNISIDTSGEPLYKRGYRSQQTEASLNEVLAAGIIAHSEWDTKMPFIDPMCGSGTLLIEAAMKASGIPAGYFRKSFGFMRWKNFDSQMWEGVKLEAAGEAIDFDGHITGLDISDQAVKIARNNIHIARMARDIELHKGDFFKTRNSGEPALIVFNPSYDPKQTERSNRDYFKNIGQHLSSQYSESTAWILVPNNEMLKSIGLEPVKRVTLLNGKNEFKLICFELCHECLQNNEEHENDPENRGTDIGW